MTPWELNILCDALKEHLACAINEGCDDKNDPHGDQRSYCFKMLELLNKLEQQTGRTKTIYINI